MKTERQQDQDVAERLRRENLERVEAGGCAPPVYTTNPESAAVEAVAWPERMVNMPCPDGSSDRIVGFRIPEGHPVLGKYGLSEATEWLKRVTIEQASALDALRGEVADRDAVIECKNIDIRERDRALHIATHKVITCGVAASHPDAELSRRMEYGSEWNSPQAEQVRELRARADAAERRAAVLSESLARTRDAIAAAPEHVFGVHYEGDDRPSWPIRDEILHSIDAALTKESP